MVIGIIEGRRQFIYPDQNIKPSTPFPILKSHPLSPASPWCEIPQLPFSIFTTQRLPHKVFTFISSKLCSQRLCWQSQIISTTDAVSISDTSAVWHTDKQYQPFLPKDLKYFHCSTRTEQTSVKAERPVSFNMGPQLSHIPPRNQIRHRWTLKPATNMQTK